MDVLGDFGIAAIGDRARAGDVDLKPVGDPDFAVVGAAEPQVGHPRTKFPRVIVAGTGDVHVLTFRPAGNNGVHRAADIDGELPNRQANKGGSRYRVHEP